MTSCIEMLKAIMLTEAWFSLAVLAKRTGYSETTISARIRDLRKPEYGGYTVERKVSKLGKLATRTVQYRIMKQRAFAFANPVNPILKHRCQYCGGKHYRVCGKIIIEKELTA